MKKFITLILALSIFSISFTNVLAQNEDMEMVEATESAESVQEINSFEVFWPIVAGKTTDSPLYFLKTLKESLRGMLILGNVQKADYNVLLSVKRTVEAEKLINEGNSKDAIKTINRAIKKVEKAKINSQKGLEAKEDFEDIGQAMVDRLKNISILAKNLASKSDEETANNLQELSNVSQNLADYLE